MAKYPKPKEDTTLSKTLVTAPAGGDGAGSPCGFPTTFAGHYGGNGVADAGDNSVALPGVDGPAVETGDSSTSLGGDSMGERNDCRKIAAYVCSVGI